MILKNQKILDKSTSETYQDKSKEDLKIQEGNKGSDDDGKSLISDWYAQNRSLVLRQTRYGHRV